jgi:hypothetical protein
VDKQQIKDQFFLGLWAYFSGPDGMMDENACMAMVETLGMAVCIAEASRLGCASRKMPLRSCFYDEPDLFVFICRLKTRFWCLARVWIQEYTLYYIWTLDLSPTPDCVWQPGPDQFQRLWNIASSGKAAIECADFLRALDVLAFQVCLSYCVMLAPLYIS